MTDRFDSLIFDMDGTLWDAVDTYAIIWNTTFTRLGIPVTVTRQDLLDLMGKPIDVIVNAICGHVEGVDLQKVQDEILAGEGAITLRLGGKLYPGVREDIPELAKHYKLFMVSNCGPEGLHNFLKYTRLEPYFTDTLTHGQTGLPKEGNILRLIERYSLKSPVYVGDVQGDADSSHRAGIPIIFAAYGFGHVSDAEYTIHSFHELSTEILKD